MAAALYRAYLRQVRALPHHYLRLFFRIKGADDFRAILETKSPQLRRTKLKRVSKDLRRLRAANGGQSTAFDRMLDIAYGRVGKLRCELIEPLLSDASPPLLSTNSQTEKTSSPVYSPELAALLTSGISHRTRALQKHHLVSPPGLSGRALLLGRLSRRREYNIRWRFFKSERNKLYPALQISLHEPTHQIDTRPFSPFNFGFHDSAFLAELFTLAGSLSRLPDSPNKQRRLHHQNISNTSPFDGGLPARWLRRRYQALLGRIPLLVPRPSSQASADSQRNYDVQLADNAITTSRPRSSRLRIVNAEDISWIKDVHLMTQLGRRYT